MLYRFLRWFLFLLSAEQAHNIILHLGLWVCKLPGVARWLRSYQLRNVRPMCVSIMGLDFSNPLGLAAGFDKNATYLPLWYALGFGFVEIGTVTPRAQQGHPKPRLFRLPKDKALVNRMGFNNKGCLHVRQNLLHK